MDSESRQLHVIFFPFLAHGHMIPMLDIARLFASRHAKATIITTPQNVPTFAKSIEKGRRADNRTPSINMEVFKFPSQEVGLPEGCENLEQAMGTDMNEKFFHANDKLEEQLERYLDKTRPDCLVADMFYPWTTDCAAKFNIPRLVFHGTSLFTLSAGEVVRLHEPYNNVSSDEEPFVIPRIPHEIKMTKSQFPEDTGNKEESSRKRRWEQVKESELKSFGVIVNSFSELEPGYADFYRKELGRRAWIIGPISLYNRSIEDKAERGMQTSIKEHECLKWLDSKKPNSVIYMCFGSTAHQISPQLHEIAMALEASGQEFIWVVKKDDGGNSQEWLPSGFEERIQGRGLIIRGWAPQVLILEHEAIGAFVTHCGWNSTLEGVSAGVPMVTWPIFADQFYNEKLITQIMKTGVPVGAKKWSQVASLETLVKRDAIEKALREIMEGDEAEQRRSRAKKLKEMAQNAIKEGGSSYSDLSALIKELEGYHA